MNTSDPKKKSTKTVDAATSTRTDREAEMKKENGYNEQIVKNPLPNHENPGSCRQRPGPEHTKMSDNVPSLGCSINIATNVAA